MTQDFESELQARVSALNINGNSSGHAPLVDMLDESNKENFQHPNSQISRRSLKANTANMIRNRSSMTSDE